MAISRHGTARVASIFGALALLFCLAGSASAASGQSGLLGQVNRPPPPGGGGGGQPPPPPPGGGGGGGGGQSPPPGGGGQTPQSPPAPDSEEVATAARSGALAAATEAAILNKLGAFGSELPDGLKTILNGMTLAPEGDKDALVAALDTADKTGAESLTVLTNNSVIPSREVFVTLSLLGAADRTAATSGQAISIPASDYYAAIGDLLARNGRPNVGNSQNLSAEVMLATLKSIQDAAKNAPPTPAPPPSSVQTNQQSPNSKVVPIITAGALVAAVILLVIIVIVMLRRRKQPPAPVAPQGPPSPDVGTMLDVSRRLASLTTTTEVEKSLISEAAALVPSTGGAVIRRFGDDLVVGYEHPQSLVVPEKLNSGLIRRCADTGQTIIQSSSTEPAIANIPVSLATIPIVGDGRVRAILLLVRGVHRPYQPADREILESLAPVAGAAMQSASETEALAHETLSDPLTGVGNRRRLDVELSRILADPANAMTSVAMVDLDHFKSVNDTLGHPAGDALLQAIAQILATTVRPNDHVYRYGGEEFCIVLPATNAIDAAAVAERALARLRESQFDLGSGTPSTATASIGVACTTDYAPADLIAGADAALYEAKESGRDRVVIAPQAPAPTN